MSNTRHSREGGPSSQRGFCSSVEYERGLLGNVVAMRCELLDDPLDKELLLALQWSSWQPGGLKSFSDELLGRFADRVCTPAMRKLGMKAGQVYTAAQVEAVRAEIAGGEDVFLLAGETSCSELLAIPEIPRAYEELSDLEKMRLPEEDGDMPAYERLEAVRRHHEAKQKAKEKAAAQPKSYPAEQFIAYCREAATGLADYLSRLCVDPESKLSEGPWWFPTLIPTLREFIEWKVESAGAGLAETQIAKLVYDGLECCWRTGELTPIYGNARIGKTSAAKSWCERHPGRARYVQVPGGNDDASFIRRIAEAYGVSSGLSFKNTQIRERVERTARASRLLLIFDEAHNLLGQDYRARKRPSRISWIMNELVNYGVPVALLATPQFEEDKQRIRERTGWNWDQFDGRVGIPIMLPQEVPERDLAAVAKAQLPSGDANSIKALVGYASWSNSQLGGIEHIVKRAKFEAARAGREVAFADIKAAIERRAPADPEVASQAFAAGARGVKAGRRNSFQPRPANHSQRQIGAEPVGAEDRGRGVSLAIGAAEAGA